MFKDLICIFLAIVCPIVCLLLFNSFITKINNREFDIITKTKDYTVFSSCVNIKDKYYCWEE